MRAGAVILALALAGCAAGGAGPQSQSQPQSGREPAATDPPAPAAEAAAELAYAGPGAVVRLDAPASIARRRVEELAVTCWLDDELPAGLMLVDRNTGEIVASGAEGELLRVGFSEVGALATDVRLAGPALSDGDRLIRMEDAVARVLEGPTPAC